MKEIVFFIIGTRYVGKISSFFVAEIYESSKADVQRCSWEKVL